MELLLPKQVLLKVPESAGYMLRLILFWEEGLESESKAHYVTLASLQLST